MPKNLIQALTFTAAMLAGGDALAQLPPADPNAPIEPKKKTDQPASQDNSAQTGGPMSASMMHPIDRNISHHTWKLIGVGYTRVNNGLLNPVASVDFETSQVISLAYNKERYKELHETKGGAIWANLLNIGAHTRFVTDDAFGASFSSQYNTPWFQQRRFDAFERGFATTEFDFGAGVGFGIGDFNSRLEFNKVLGFYPGGLNNNLAMFNYIRDEVRFKTKVSTLMSNNREWSIYASFMAGVETHNPYGWFDPLNIGEKQKMGPTVGFTIGVGFGGKKVEDYKHIKIKDDDTSLNDGRFTGNDAYYVFKMEAVPQDELAEVKGLEAGATAIHFNAAPEILHQGRVENMAKMGIVVLEAPPITDLMGLNVNDVVVAQRPEIEQRPGLTDQYGNPVSSGKEPSKLVIT